MNKPIQTIFVLYNADQDTHTHTHGESHLNFIFLYMQKWDCIGNDIIFFGTSSIYKQHSPVNLLSSYTLHHIHATINEFGWHINTHNSPHVHPIISHDNPFFISVRSINMNGKLYWKILFLSCCSLFMCVWERKREKKRARGRERWRERARGREWREREIARVCVSSGVHPLNRVTSSACQMHQFSVDDSQNNFYMQAECRKKLVKLGSAFRKKII